MALLRGKLFAGALFAGVLLNAAVEQVPVAPVQAVLQPGGVRFIPVKVGETATKSLRIDLRFGEVTAVGVDGTIPISVSATSATVNILAPPAKATGHAVTGVGTARVESLCGGATVSAAATCNVASVPSPMSCGGSVVSAGGTAHAATQYVAHSLGGAEATGIRNLTDEELIAMVIRHRNSKHLQPTTKSGRVARI